MSYDLHRDTYEQMKIQFKHKAYQEEAVNAVADVFAGEPKQEGLNYRIDPGKELPIAADRTRPQAELALKLDTELDLAGGDPSQGFRNHPIKLTRESLLENIHKVQKSKNLPLSKSLVSTKNCDLNLDVEMETGTGKTYVYIKTMFELNRRYGWSKFIVVVPSIAIREGVQKSFEMTADHFHQDYGKRPRFFTYDSKQLHNLESYSSDSGINVMIINVQAFNARGKDARRIYEELDEFQSRRPIDVIKANNPILIIDEPQKMEGAKTVESLKEFNPLFVLRYSATHKTEHNKVHRLDAIDAYNQRLVKKIAVRGITTKGLSGTNSYLYLESIEISSKKPPIARIEIEQKTNSGIKRVTRKLGKGDNLQELSNGLEQYDGFVITDIDATLDKVTFTNGIEITSGVAHGDVNESVLRRIQIRETIRAHFEKEKILFDQGIKVLSLFFIDEVAKYRQYNEQSEALPGEYATIFEEEYTAALNEFLELDDSAYQRHLKQIDTSHTHNGYFSIDKKGKLTDPKISNSGEDKGLASDVSAYDLILKDKERLLSFDEPTRFIFSHSALREGWDNPNVFTICTLKHSDNTISRRQEVGRGMRLCVNQHGERIDNPVTAHQTNVLTVVTNESYEDFVKGLQKDISTTLSSRPLKADEAYFTGKTITDEHGEKNEITPQQATDIFFYLVQNKYVDREKKITENYHQAKKEGKVAELPDDLLPFQDSVFALIDSVFTEGAIPKPENDRGQKLNPLNPDNFHKKEFQELWSKINRKAVYTVDFDSSELIKNATKELNQHLIVKPLQFHIRRGEQDDALDYDKLNRGDTFSVKENETNYSAHSINSGVRYDLIGQLAEHSELTRKTITQILKGLDLPVFNQFKTNPEDFIHQASRLIKEQKATAIIEHLTYNPVDDYHEQDIFTANQEKVDVSNTFKANKHVFDYVVTESKSETNFAQQLDTSKEVTVYSKLPKGFKIPTPVGDYNPDWAIAFEEGKVKHIYFIAETKGSMSSLELREIEKAKIQCAHKFFDKISSDQVKYDMVDSYEKLMNIVV